MGMSYYTSVLVSITYYSTVVMWQCPTIVLWCSSIVLLYNCGSMELSFYSISVLGNAQL